MDSTQLKLFAVGIVVIAGIGIARPQSTTPVACGPCCLLRFSDSEQTAPTCGDQACSTVQASLPKPASEPPKEVERTPKAKGPPGKDDAFNRDRDTFHFLLEHHKSIKRTVKKLENGVETLTESDNPDVARKIQEHVPAMYERLNSGKGVRYWDPLFAEAFKHGSKMKMTIEKTKTGVKVIETSTDAEVVKLIIAHAEVVTQFVEKGFEEARKEHPVPIADKKK